MLGLGTGLARSTEQEKAHEQRKRPGGRHTSQGPRWEGGDHRKRVLQEARLAGEARGNMPGQGKGLLLG